MTTPCNVLLVEDNEGDIELVERALTSECEECYLTVASNGGEALDFLHHRGEFCDAKTPDIILLDINMPGMGGKEFLEQIRAEEQLRLIPTIMLTSSTADRDVADCYARHANCYVVKPFDGKVHMAVVRQVVSYWANLACLPTRICSRG